ncbi:Alpha/Beta hydrolase protein [Cyathus striatus]|nr:Alpha/Beta hydrolase protein [Cyathus striatus]
MCKLIVPLFSIYFIAQLVGATFHPDEYSSLTSTASCTAVLRSSVPETQVPITLEYVDINPNATNTILMVHGWPSLWSSWARQIEEFQAEYRLIIPNLRGFGGSSHPGDVRSSGTMGDMVGDLMCILQHAGVLAETRNNVVCMGHDWGSQICYETARIRPDVVTHVIGVAVPYIPSAGPFIPISHLISVLPALSYQLNRDKRRMLRAVLRTVDSPPPEIFLKSQDDMLGAWDGIEVSIFSTEEEDYFVKAYEKQGFEYKPVLIMGLANTQGNITIPQPVLAVYPTQDPVADWTHAEKLLKSSAYLPNLTTKLMKGAHWMHMEYPEVFNRIVREWLDKNVHIRKDEVVHEEL